MNIEVLLNSYIRINYINDEYDTGDLNTIDDERNIITITTNTGKELFIPPFIQIKKHPRKDALFSQNNFVRVQIAISSF
ncbi:hypothetical protein [Priestia megaterium]|uniref:hypothetical protein n=1 Tax=Priestia megaterium TaxID=1404 RepID=UPI00101B89DC|nr:hypothetical protein [Priestia megaterium]